MTAVLITGLSLLLRMKWLYGRHAADRLFLARQYSCTQARTSERWRGKITGRIVKDQARGSHKRKCNDAQCPP
jgi:hypothetical protein